MIATCPDCGRRVRPVLLHDRRVDDEPEPVRAVLDVDPSLNGTVTIGSLAENPRRAYVHDTTALDELELRSEVPLFTVHVCRKASA